MALQPDRSRQADPHHRPPDFGAHGEDPPLSSASRLLHEHIFTAPAASPDSDLRAVVNFLDTWPGALGTIDPSPDLLALLDRTRAGLPDSARTPTGSTSTSAEMRAILFGRYGWPFSVFCWVLAAITWGTGLLVAWAVAYVRVRHVSTAQQTAAGEPLEVRRVQVAQHWAREPHIEQLAPGTSTTRTTRFRVGITEQQTRDLSAHLGMSSVRPDWPDLSARLTSSRVTEESTEIEKTIHLSNDRIGYYRRIALWHPVDTVRIETLLLGAGLQWVERARASYNTSAGVATSFIDIAQADI